MSEEDLGPYLLGQLDPRREAEVAALVAACASCTDEVAGLREVVTAMAAASAPPATEPYSEPPPHAPRAGLATVLTTIRRERRHRWTGRRVAAAAAAAAVAALAGGVFGSQLVQDPPDREVVLAREFPAPDGQEHATARVALEGRSWGTSLELEATGLDPGQIYGVWLERREGERLTAGSFVPTDDGTVRLDLSSGLALKDSWAVGVALLPGGRMAGAVDVLSARLDQPGG